MSLFAKKIDFGFKYPDMGPYIVQRTNQSFLVYPRVIHLIRVVYNWFPAENKFLIVHSAS